MPSSNPVAKSQLGWLDRFKKLNRKLIYILIALVIVSASVSATLTYWLSRPAPLYPLDFEANFLASCINAGDSAYGCICPLRYFERHLSYKEAQAVDKQATKTGKLPRNLQQIFNDCAKHKAS